MSPYQLLGIIGMVYLIQVIIIMVLRDATLTVTGNVILSWIR